MEATIATKTTGVLEDDLDGGPAEETVRFGIGSTSYGIGLNASNTATFRRQLAHTSNTLAGRHKTAAAAGRTTASRERGAHIRAWAKDHGIALSCRGRIPADVGKQYQVGVVRPKSGHWV